MILDHRVVPPDDGVHPALLLGHCRREETCPKSPKSGKEVAVEIESAQHAARGTLVDPYRTVPVTVYVYV